LTLSEAIELSRRDALIMQFAEYGKYILPVLRKIEGEDEYLTQLRSACNTAAQYTSRYTASLEKKSGGLASLTGREKEVLSLMMEGLGRTGVAERLVIAPGTVKTLTAAVYRKLNVRSAREAILLVKESGWKNDDEKK
jgi:DNA-binding NarL/FixJ family response regulator